MNTTLSLDFSLAKQAVAKQFAHMAKSQLFRVAATPEEMWTTYLSSFPPGTNPMFRERTEHDCSCCRHFIRDIGNVVAVIDGKIVTVWDHPTGDPAYDAVFETLARFVRYRPIVEPFLHGESHAGTDKSHEQQPDGKVHTWPHFHVTVPSRYVTPRRDIPSVLSDRRATHDVLKRGLEELTLDAFDQFLELVAQGSLYRGEEFKSLVQKFRTLKVAYLSLKPKERAVFVWLTTTTETTALCRLRNSAVGTLLVNLSEDMDLEAAVKAYESVVAPQNYKRPTALVTKAMVERAKKDIEALGLTSALHRRHAVLTDISINNVLFADRGARRVMQDVFDEVPTVSRKPQKFEGIEEVPIERFVTDMITKLDTIEVLVENRHQNNFVSLIAPTDPAAGLLFKWPNPFSWSYKGEVADSIKERVKKAGGNVTGDLCCRLAWSNYDDLDLHMEEPDGGHIYFATRSRASRCGGMLDVDMNAGHGQTRTPVENIFYHTKNTMKEGNYKLYVHNFNNRDMTDPGFEVEIDIMGETFHFSSLTSPRTGQTVEIATIKYSRTNGFTLITKLENKSTNKKVWNIDTENFHRVNVMLLSPNYWDDSAVGNKHYFFMLDGCVNDESARGFYNEFLMPVVAEHRKVLELVGSKTKPVPASEQLSGLGFSSTQKNHLICRVSGSFTRTIKLVF